MIFIAVVLILGLVTKQPRRYWLFALAAVATQLLVGFLFAGGGTLGDSRGDGMITAWLRRVTNDGPQMGLLGLGVIALGWGLPIWLLTRGYSRKPKLPAASST